jgi:starch synthase/alpha-amylase
MQLVAEIFYQFISKYWRQNLQVVFVANGDYQMVFRDIWIIMDFRSA